MCVTYVSQYPKILLLGKPGRILLLNKSGKITVYWNTLSYDSQIDEGHKLYGHM